MKSLPSLRSEQERIEKAFGAYDAVRLFDSQPSLDPQKVKFPWADIRAWFVTTWVRMSGWLWFLKYRHMRAEARRAVARCEQLVNSHSREVAILNQKIDELLSEL